jgi:mannose-6-phosphate isomerase-like protein (cupin superfamily)
MLTPIRRVVTGLNAEGRSIILSDETVTTVGEVQSWPGNGVTAVWTSNISPANSRDKDLPRLITDFPRPGRGQPDDHAHPSGSRVGKTVARAARTGDHSRRAHVSRGTGDRHFQIVPVHATDTVDYLIMLSGELTMMVDNGEVTLKPFDTLIQRGVNHGWVNRGTDPALIAAAVIDAEPLERKRKPES